MQKKETKGVKSHQRVPVIACVEDKSGRWLGRGEGPDCQRGKRDEEEEEEMGNGSMLCGCYKEFGNMHRQPPLSGVKSCRAGVSAVAMSSLVRNAAANFSRRVDGYELLDQNDGAKEETCGQYRTFSKRRAQSVVASLSYRRDRARRRQIFLRSYKLSAVGDDWGRPKTKPRKLRKVVLKVKKVVESLVSLMRIGSLKSCYAAGPISIKKCC
ncbi:hypothetical protein V6N11_028086 [Hibiscus sabdariffa]|uniref:Uncharacterized protein n=1 Tax=Hibiscus sabdariffa TaxID=183260 RepID=A0ABR2P0A6_9ROSI